MGLGRRPGQQSRQSAVRYSSKCTSEFWRSGSVPYYIDQPYPQMRYQNWILVVELRIRDFEAALKKTRLTYICSLARLPRAMLLSFLHREKPNQETQLSQLHTLIFGKEMVKYPE